MGPCTRTHRSLDQFLGWCVLMLLVLTGAATAAQNRRTNSNQRQVVLRIRAEVVPAAMLPSPKKKEQQDSITYDLAMPQPMAGLKMSVIEEIRPLPQAFRNSGWGAKSGNIVLKTLTVVPQ